jgi:hypothetical protein
VKEVPLLSKELNLSLIVRNSMANKGLNGLALISIDRETASTLNLDEFVIELAKNHWNRKIALF